MLEETKTPKCKICTQPIEVNGIIEEDRARMLHVGICYNCDFWMIHFQDRDSALVGRISGEHYRIGEPNATMKGMSGNRITIKFNDGRIVETDNLWHQGTIPEHLKLVLPDNATFAR